MQRKPGFPAANCSIRMPDGMTSSDSTLLEDDAEQFQQRQQLINFGHSQWGFKDWSWSVTKQDLDFVDFASGKYTAGVCAYVSVTVKTFDIHRENIGYATEVAPSKGAAICKSRKYAVTNALRETLLSFGGKVATELTELLAPKTDTPVPAPPEPQTENNQNILNKPSEPKNSLAKGLRKDPENSLFAIRSHPGPPSIKNAVVPNPPPIAKAHPMPVNLPPAANRPVLPANTPRPPPQLPRPNPNDLQSLESMSEEEARAERKRRQQRAQEDFRLKMLKQNSLNDDKQDMSKASSSSDALLMDIPTQDIEIEETGQGEEGGKRRSPSHDGSGKRRASVINRLDIVTD